jgi:hypothetical protein
MRNCFIEAKSKKDAQKKAPWAAKIVKVEGGYHAFESIVDYTNWSKQKMTTHTAAKNGG